MNWREKILAAWPNNPQSAYRAQQALRELEGALAALAGLGHPLHVEEGHQPPPHEPWPKVVFHLRAGERVVRCQADLDELGPDWYPTMDEARHAAGVTKQMQRGGIFDKALPSANVMTAEERAQIETANRLERERVHKTAMETRVANRRRGNGKIDMPGSHATTNKLDA